MSSFVKIAEDNKIPGTRTSLQNGQTITSSGNPSLDYIIGGGLPIGSVILIEEDKFVTYSRILAKYFLAEGIYSGHSIFLGSLDDDIINLVRSLPTPVDDSLNTSYEKAQQPFRDQLKENRNEMRIAWRYSDLPKVNSEQTTLNIGRNFNINEKIDEEVLKNADITTWSGISSEEESIEKAFKNRYVDLLQKLLAKAKCDKFFNYESGQGDHNKSLLRICLTSLGSPLWHSEEFTKDFMKFLTVLKSIVRKYVSICFLTVPMHLVKLLDEDLAPRIHNLVDYAIELESFVGSSKETNPAFNQYHGLLNIKKFSALNTLAVFRPETTDLAFKLRGKKFVIEKLHLPPELQEEDQTADVSAALSCASNQNLLDF